MIPAEAVEAAAWGIYRESFAGHSAASLEQVGGPIREECLRKARAALEAAAPFIEQAAYDRGFDEGHRAGQESME